MRLMAIGIAILMLSAPVWAEDHASIDITEPLDIRSPTIDYFGDFSTDSFATLKQKIDHGDVVLKPQGSSGYLLDLLRLLNIPVASQSLVFSKTSFQQELVSPKNPRAIFFNDDVTVGWVPGSKFLEIAAQDPQKGPIYYTLTQPDTAASTRRPESHRDTRCTDCHVNPATLNVPGYLLRSFQVDSDGERDFQSAHAEVTHATPFVKRWGGWYITGRSEKLVHLGNLFGEDEFTRHETEGSWRGTLQNLTSLVDLTRYPSAHSDIVAMMVLEHQAHFHNLVTRVNYENRLNRHSDAEGQLARYALMEDEAPLPGPVTGLTEYTTWYQSRGCRDGNGRNLRQLNLKTRLFEHKISPLIRSRAFQSLPEDVKSRLWVRFRKERGDVIDLNPLKTAVQSATGLPRQF